MEYKFGAMERGDYGPTPPASMETIITRHSGSSAIFLKDLLFSPWVISPVSNNSDRHTTKQGYRETQTFSPCYILLQKHIGQRRNDRCKVDLTTSIRGNVEREGGVY